MTRDELILRTRQLIAEGERLAADPSMTSLATWLQLSDDLLAHAWGTMDRYHLAWLMVGKPKGIVRGRQMTPDEEAAYVREVASQKGAALRMSLDAVERQGMPFVGETGGVGPGVETGVGAGQAAGVVDPGETAAFDPTEPVPNGDALAMRHAHLAQGSRRAIPLDPEMQRRLDEARHAADEHAAHDAGPGAGGEAATRRAPRPARLQR
ncbi:MAG: hypothetical protein ABIR11_03920 [Candidatus Limnocylindrales bacterium]